MNILIATVQVPFVRGGGELLAEGLKAAITRHGHRVDILTAPFRFSPSHEVEKSMEWWAGQHLSAFCAGSVDRVIYLKFPSYYASHGNAVLWLLHQHRAYYELWNEKEQARADGAVRREVIRRDTETLGKIERRYTIAKRVSDRLKSFNGLDSTPLYHPPFGERLFFSGESLPYVFSPSRLEPLKRQMLLVEAMALVKGTIGAVIAGEGGAKAALERRISELDLGDRVKLVGRVSDQDLRAYYARSRCVFFGPFDEDYGYISLEAMLSSKPVITCRDSGGTLEFVNEGINGRVVDPEPAAIAQAIDAYAASPELSQRHGAEGRRIYDDLGISWDHVVKELLK